MTQHTRTIAGQPVKIHTAFDYPPIPTRSFDWSAVTDNYDCDGDSEGFFTTHPVGHGATEDEALADLIGQLEDRAEDSARCAARNAEPSPSDTPERP
jgi:hypothetical protein